MALIIDGKKIASEIQEEIRREVAALEKRLGAVPGLAVVLVGNDPGSAVYVRNKGRACEEAGFASFQYTLPENTPQEELVALVDELNTRDDVDGILVQLPLPKHMDEAAIINRIDPQKDVDAFHPANVGKILIGDESGFLPCTPQGCKILINRAVPSLRGKHLVVVGRSNIVGKPMAAMMLQKKKDADCIVTVCHTAAPDISYYTRQADVLVVAAGRAGMITGSMVKEGAVVIDVGMNRIPHPDDPSKTKLVGDVKFDEVEKIASAITPVPGGVGPMTITMLLSNTLKAFRMHREGS
jgi:methylenetetrahydrofolate dehydrogenase (NADP+)/methenyltetrahydrofolate cyclohydrolase